MGAAQKRARIRFAWWFLVPAAAALSLAGLAVPAGASSRSNVAAGTLGSVLSVVSDHDNGSSCALLSTGRVDCWGYNNDGELGNGTTASSDVPVAVRAITNAKAIVGDNDGGSYGGSFCAVLATGQVKCWGYNNDGELGNGTTISSTVPVPVKNITKPAAIVGGEYGFCALLSSDHVDCWGYGAYGELGNGSFSTNSDVPVAVRKITNAATVIAGDFGYCARLSTSHVDCWGYNGYGELGNRTTTNSDVPVGVTGITNATAVASHTGSGSSCALLSTGRVDCWGYNGDGELGNGTTTSSDVPVTVHSITNAKAVIRDTNGEGLGGSFCALLSTSHVDCWGYNNDGELGNGTTTTFTVPVSVKNITAAATVVGADYGFCALLSSHHVDCWGYGAYGELGNGSFSTNSDVPVAVRKITNAATVNAGNYSFCSLLSTGHVDCWGYNGYGELGNGSTTNSDVPVAVAS